MELDLQQKAAVETDSWRTMVIAGAGSGKTRVLVERIAHLIENEHVSPHEIACFTFTRKAAGEMKQRLQERIGNQAFKLEIGTLHALALRMINRFGDVIGMKSKAVTVYSDWEEQYLLKDVAKEMGIFNGKSWKIPKAEVQEAFDRYYQRGLEPDKDDRVEWLFRQFIQRCRENNSMTYGGLMIGLKLLIPTLAEHLPIKHVLVDEVQDIDHLQWEIILQMEAKFGAKLFVVGDVDQSIYEWRGAAPKYLVDHQDEFEIYRIESNYRSHKDIVHAANRLIEHNMDRITKTMEPKAPEKDGPDKHFPGIVVKENLDSEAVAEWLNQGDTDGVAVLGRNHFLLEKLSEELEKLEVKHTYVGRTRSVMETEAFRKFHAFLKLAVNPFDNFSFLLMKDSLCMSREEYTSVRVRAAENSSSHYHEWVGSSDYRLKFMGRDHRAIDGAAEVSALLGPDFSPAAMAFVDAYHHQQGGTIAQYLEWLALYEVQDEMSEGLQLMTIHGSKGLEFPIVVLIGVNEGILPSEKAVDQEEMEAETRLMYVAMTRAKDQLVLAVRPELTVKQTERGAKEYRNPKSRYIDWIGGENE